MCKVFAIITLSFVLVTSTSPKRSITMRILKGNDAAIGQFPFIVSVIQEDLHLCGGSILSNRCVLSAAHCVTCRDNTGQFTLQDVNKYSIRAGSNEHLCGGVISKVAEFVVHENYFKDLHDLSIIRLETPLDYSNTIKAIALDTTEVPVGTTVTIAGWGKLSPTDVWPSTKLQYTTLKVLSKSICDVEACVDTSDIYCLDRPVNHGFCSGDSGSPGILAEKLVAVAAFVIDDCGLDHPDAFTKISTHLDWIRAHTDICIE